MRPRRGNAGHCWDCSPQPRGRPAAPLAAAPSSPLPPPLHPHRSGTSPSVPMPPTSRSWHRTPARGQSPGGVMPHSPPSVRWQRFSIQHILSIRRGAMALPQNSPSACPEPCQGGGGGGGSTGSVAAVSPRDLAAHPPARPGTPSRCPPALAARGGIGMGKPGTQIPAIAFLPGSPPGGHPDVNRCMYRGSSPWEPPRGEALCPPPPHGDRQHTELVTCPSKQSHPATAARRGWHSCRCEQHPGGGLGGGGGGESSVRRWAGDSWGSRGGWRSTGCPGDGGTDPATSAHAFPGRAGRAGAAPAAWWGWGRDGRLEKGSPAPRGGGGWGGVKGRTGPRIVPPQPKVGKVRRRSRGADSTRRNASAPGRLPKYGCFAQECPKYAAKQEQGGRQRAPGMHRRHRHHCRHAGAGAQAWGRAPTLPAPPTLPPPQAQPAWKLRHGGAVSRQRCLYRGGGVLRVLHRCHPPPPHSCCSWSAPILLGLR